MASCWITYAQFKICEGATSATNRFELRALAPMTARDLDFTIRYLELLRSALIEGKQEDCQATSDEGCSGASST